MNVYDFSAKTIEGKDKPLSEYRGKVLLIVNVASRCGFTPPYEGLQKLYAKYQPKGLEILGFPCNQFGAQEPGTESEIQSFCELNFGVKFQLFAKIDVNGEKTHPLFKYLTKDLPGILGTEAIKWNFAKFLVDKEGNPVKRYGSAEKPEGLEKDIEKLL
jgi:glutathione peroxidase